MHSAPKPEAEALRLAALDSIDLFYTPAEERFDRLTRVAAHALDAPLAMLSLIGARELWFKSRVGLVRDTTGRERSPCAQVILGQAPMVVEDARYDLRFFDHPLVQGEPGIRFYAGIPLGLALGVKVGTLCVADRVPRRVGPDELGILTDLARVAETELQQERCDVMRATERRLLEQAERRHLIDAATGCWNRAGFEALLQLEVRQAEAMDLPFALLILLVDDFGSRRRQLGEEAAEGLLAEVAGRLRRVLQRAGSVSRFAPESFALLISPCDKMMLGRAQRRLRAVLQEQPYRLPGQTPVSLQISCGAAIVGSPGFDAALALVDADRRLGLARRRAVG